MALCMILANAFLVGAGVATCFVVAVAAVLRVVSCFGVDENEDD